MRMQDLPSSMRAWIVVVASAAAPFTACAADERRPPRDVRTTSAPAPASPVTLASPPPENGAPGTLGRDYVQRRVTEQIANLPPKCAEVEREIDPYEATLHLEIAASGEVEIARARGNHPLLDACVSDVARTWRFEPSSGRTVVNVPIAVTKPGPRP